MSIESLPFERRPRNSIANNLDKINELVDWANLGTHLYASATGESVTMDDASSVKGLTVDGRSVQNGTPTPGSPVPVQVVGGKNLLPLAAQTVTNRGVTATVDTSGTMTITGTATGGNAALTIPVASDVPLANNVDYTAQRVTVSGSLDGTFYVRGIDDANQTMHHLFNLASVNERTASFANNAIIQAIYIVISENTTIDCVLHVQVEQGSNATPYVPYGSIGIVVGDTVTPIDLQGNVLASLPDGTRDELHVDSAGHVWIDSNLHIWNMRDYADNVNWRKSGSAINGYYLSMAYMNPRPMTVAGGASASGMLCNIALARNTVNIYYNTPNSCIIDSNFNFNLDPAVVGSSLEEFKTWLSTHDVYVVAKIATPQTIDLGYITPPAIPSGSVVTISASLTPTFHLEWWVDDGIIELVNDLIAYIDYKTEG